MIFSGSHLIPPRRRRDAHLLPNSLDAVHQTKTKQLLATISSERQTSRARGMPSPSPFRSSHPQPQTPLCPLPRPPFPSNSIPSLCALPSAVFFIKNAGFHDRNHQIYQEIVVSDHLPLTWRGSARGTASSSATPTAIPSATSNNPLPRRRTTATPTSTLPTYSVAPPGGPPSTSAATAWRTRSTPNPVLAPCPRGWPTRSPCSGKSEARLGGGTLATISMRTYFPGAILDHPRRGSSTGTPSSLRPPVRGFSAPIVLFSLEIRRCHRSSGSMLPYLHIELSLALVTQDSSPVLRWSSSLSPKVITTLFDAERSAITETYTL